MDGGHERAGRPPVRQPERAGVDFNPDGQNLAYEVLWNKAWSMVLNGKEGEKYTMISKCSPVFSPS
jgi:hypothetical protein